MIWLALLLFQNLPEGERVFAQSCSVGYCHGVAGAAGRGPRLRGRALDHNYLLKVTREGIPNSAMPGWKGKLTDAQIEAVVAYIASLANASEQAPPANPMPPGTGPATLAAFKGPATAERGHSYFFDASREARCGACHSLGGRGIPVGPDLSEVAKKPARDIAAGIRSSRSTHVLVARLRDGETFPALLYAQDDKLVKVYDLTAPPPVLRTLERSEVVSLTPHGSWRHDEAVKGISQAQLDDVIAYIRWAALGSTDR